MLILKIYFSNLKIAELNWQLNHIEEIPESNLVTISFVLALIYCQLWQQCVSRFESKNLLNWLRYVDMPIMVGKSARTRTVVIVVSQREKIFSLWFYQEIIKNLLIHTELRISEKVNKVSFIFHIKLRILRIIWNILRASLEWLLCLIKLK